MSVKEVRNPASESETSDVEARSPGEATPPSTPGTSRTERKSIGRSVSVTSSGPFVATPEWVSESSTLKFSSKHELSNGDCKVLQMSVLRI